MLGSTRINPPIITVLDKIDLIIDHGYNVILYLSIFVVQAMFAHQNGTIRYGNGAGNLGPALGKNPRPQWGWGRGWGLSSFPKRGWGWGRGSIFLRPRLRFPARGNIIVPNPVPVPNWIKILILVSP